MANFVHIAPAKLEARIRRSGVKPGAPLFGGRGGAVVFAFPVIESHMLTHQWTREVLKWRRQPLIGVYFRVANEEPVLLGHYQGATIEMPAWEAAGVVRRMRDPRGVEVMLRGSVSPRAITRIAPLRGVIGWRHMPDAHARRPCGCPACSPRGEPGARKLRARYDARVESER
jgi:hypothetical protein